jgi:hypothetical protein
MIGQDLSLRSCGEQLRIEELIAEPAVVDEVKRSSYDSANSFSHGEPGAMVAVLVMVPASHQSRRAWAMNCGPLSLRMNNGAG